MIITGKKFSKPELSRIINGDVELPAAEEKPEKQRIDLILTNIYKSYNRSTLQKFIEHGFVKVNGEIVTKSNAKFEPDVHIDLEVPEAEKNADLKPTVIYEDEKVLVLNKPAGLLSMAKDGYCPEKTLEEYGLLVHRLDRDTSGVIIMAKDQKTQSFLRRQFQERTAHKTYYAVVSGTLKLDAARIDLPMKRDLKRPTTFRVDAAGKAAETFYQVLKTDGVHTLAELKPTTGRTHQLRVHMKYLGHPIVGDVLYGGEPYNRLMLHAGSLEITIPGATEDAKNQRKTFSAPLPLEFEEIFNTDLSQSVAKSIVNNATESEAE